MFGNHEDLLNEIDIESIENAISELKTERPDLNIVDRTISITDGIIMLLEITGPGGSHMIESQLEYRYGYIAISNAAPGFNDDGEEVVIENMLEYDGDDEYQRNGLFQYFKSTVLNQVYLIRRLYSGNNENDSLNTDNVDQNSNKDPERKIAVSHSRKTKTLPPLSRNTSSYPPLSEQRNLSPLQPDIQQEKPDEYSASSVSNTDQLVEEQEPENGSDNYEKTYKDDQFEQVQPIPQQSYLRFDIQDIRSQQSRNKHYLEDEDDTIDESYGTLDVEDDFGYYTPIDAEDIDNDNATVIETEEDNPDVEQHNDHIRSNKGFNGMFT